MNEYAYYGLGIAGIAGVALGVDWYLKKDNPGASGRSIAGNVAGVVGGAVERVVNPECAVPTFKTWFPVQQGDNVEITTVENNSLYGVAKLGDAVFGIGRGKMVALMASLETHNGSLKCRCYNANLFNIHARCGGGSFIAMVGTDKDKSFTRNASTVTIEHFRDCMLAFKGILERASDYDEVLLSGDPNRMQLLMARVNFGGRPTSVYNRFVNGGTIVDPFFRERYDILRAHSLIP